MSKEVKKIEENVAEEVNTQIVGQGCKTDCYETNVWVGKTKNGSPKTCFLYDEAYTPKTTGLW